jgi:fatty-acid desaturase
MRVETAAVKWKKDNVVGFLVVHLISTLAFFPWFFSWTGVALFVAGIVVFGALGINLCYHRLLTHRSFSCPLWLEHGLAILAACSMQDSPPHWVAVHRWHHQFADEEQDPHSPLKSFFWAHMGWLLVKKEKIARRALVERYAKDISRDPFYAWIERRNNWMRIALLTWLGFFAVGFAFVLLAGGDLSDAIQFGLSLLIWGGALRTVFVWHTTWSVNSLSHIWGYRNYTTSDASRNNTLVALLAFGEGWHNNHHADSRSARHGHKWWEFDPTWLAIRSLMLLGLAKNVALPSPVLAAKFSTSELRRTSSEQKGLESVAWASIQSQGDRIDATSANDMIE